MQLFALLLLAAPRSRRAAAAGSQLEAALQKIAVDEAWVKSQLDEHGCMGPTVAHNVFLRERNATTGTVTLPPRPADLDCYARTAWRKTLTRGATAAAGQVSIAVLVNGEVSRLDPAATFVHRVVGPWALAGHHVVVVLSLQARRQRAVRGDWHADRFAGLQELTDGEIEARLDAVAQRCLDAGAAAVQLHVYDLVRRPTLMPSLWTGGPGHASAARRFRVAWASYPLHLLVHSLVWRDAERFEAGDRDGVDAAPRKPVLGRGAAEAPRASSWMWMQNTSGGTLTRAPKPAAWAFDFVLKMRGDTAWVGDAPTPNADAVITKACLHWGGINDKVALMPRRFAPHWLGLLEQYYDHTLHGYQNSEMFQKILAAKHGIPIEERRLPAVDYYHWLADEAGEMGCFPTNYVSNTCFEPDAWARVKRRICAKGRQA